MQKRKGETGKCDAEEKGRDRQENVMQKRKGITNRKSWALDYTWIKRSRKEKVQLWNRKKKHPVPNIPGDE